MYTRKRTDYSEAEISDLPMEVILYILNHLSVSDRIAFGATCHRFYEASCDLAFCDKQKLVLYKTKMEPDESPIRDLQRCRRPFLHFHFEHVELGDKLNNFWNHFGPSMRSLSFRYCGMQEKTLVEALNTCSSLEELRIFDCRELFMSGRLLESTAEVSSLKSQLQKLNTLDLTMNRYLSDALFNRLVGLANNVRCLVLNGCHISFHNGLYRKFYPIKGTNGPSESILTFHYILEFLKLHATSLKSLNFSNTLIDGSALSSLSETIGLKLEILRLESCEQLTNAGILSMTKHQNCLVELNFSFSTRLTDQSLIAICENLLNLRRLYLRRCRAVTNTGIMQVRKLINLEELDISECNTVNYEGVEEGICSKYNSSFKNLQISALDIIEKQVILIAENLPNLTVLDLCACRYAVTDQSVQKIFQHLRWLQVLRMDHCYGFSDAGLTGVGLSNTCSASQSTDNVQVPITEYQKISLRSKMEKEIVADFNHQKMVKQLCEEQHYASDPTGYSIARLRGLRELKLKGCKITDVSLKYCFEFPELRKLNLSHCHQITLAGIEQMVKSCPAIEKLNLIECHNVTDAVILCIVKHLPRLKVLQLNNCTQITNHALDSISMYCKTLKYLSLKGCRSLDPHIMPNLNTRGPYRTVEYSAENQIMSADNCPLPPIMSSFYSAM